MLIYNYDDEGVYLSSGDARLDPIESASLIPRNATVIAPPEALEGFALVFDGTCWQQVVDNRGVVYWISREEIRTIAKIGEDVPEGAFLVQPEVDNELSISEDQPEWLLQRVASYPKVGDALNALFDAMKAGVISKVEPWYNQCEAVKEAFPKQ
jgi:hypothetical protein